MLKKNYYFLITVLPPLKIEAEPDISFYDLMYLFIMNLSDEDLDKLRRLRMRFDILNIYQYLTKEALDPRGNFSKKELEEALINQVRFPDYVFDFLNSYESKEERVQYFTRLITAYYHQEIENSTGFLREYLTFERNLSLVMAAFRAKHHGRDLNKEFQFEDATDLLVRELLVGKGQPEFIFPFEYSDLEPILTSISREPMQEFRAMNKYRYQKVMEMAEREEFSIDWLLSYTVRLMLLEDWWRLDDNRGNLILNEIVKEIA
jgi:hypothetical protein